MSDEFFKNYTTLTWWIVTFVKGMSNWGVYWFNNR